jgi:O-antigen/teichoic acid export membrane protein
VFKQADVLTAAGRGRERYRRAFLYFSSAALPRAVGFLIPLITIPLTLSYLGAERFGLWMTIASFLALLSFADLGLGNGLVNVLAEANGKNDRHLARRSLSSAFFMLTAFAAFWALLFLAAYPWLSWERLFAVSDPVAVAEAGPALAVFIGCFLLNLPLGIVQRAQLSYQEGHVYNLWEALGKLLALAAVIFVVWQRLGVPWLILALTGVPLTTALINGVVFFRRRYSWLTPRWAFAEAAVVRRLAGVGLLFFVYQLGLSLGSFSDNVILAQLLGPEAVAAYVIPLRLFEIITVMNTTFCSALWPAYREAIARKELPWVKATLTRSIFISLAVTGVLSALLILWGDEILRLWLGSEIEVGLSVWIGFGVWKLVTHLGYVFAVFLYSANAVRFQAVTMVLFAVAAVAMKLLLIPAWGIMGLIVANALAYVVFILIPIALVLPRKIRDLLAEEAAPL